MLHADILSVLCIIPLVAPTFKALLASLPINEVDLPNKRFLVRNPTPKPPTVLRILSRVLLGAIILLNADLIRFTGLK